MAKLTWDEAGKKLYETGTDRGVVYPYDTENKRYGAGAAWNGLTGFTDSPSGADETALWADNIKYVAMRAAEEYGGTITAYTYPDEFAECDGSVFADTKNIVNVGQQKRKAFGFSCRTLVGNDTELNDYAYKIHLVYNATVSPSDKDYATVNDSPDAIEFSWEFTTTPINVGTKYKPTAHLTIDTSKIGDDATARQHLADLESVLYGGEEYYEKLTSETQPADWPAIPQGGTASTKYYTYDSEHDIYEGVTVSDTYAANTYYLKHAAHTPRLPLPAEVIEMFGGTVDTAQG